MGAADDLTIAGDQIRSAYGLMGVLGPRRAADVVDAFQQDQAARARGDQGVGVQTLQTRWTRALMQQAVSADAGVDDRPGATGVHQARGQPFRPAAGAIGQGAGALGDGVAEGHDDVGRGGAFHLDPGQQDAETHGRALHAVRASHRLAPAMGRKAGGVGQGDADLHLIQSRDGQIDRIRDQRRVGRHDG